MKPYCTSSLLITSKLTLYYNLHSIINITYRVVLFFIGFFIGVCLRNIRVAIVLYCVYSQEVRSLRTFNQLKQCMIKLLFSIQFEHTIHTNILLNMSRLFRKFIATINTTFHETILDWQLISTQTSFGKISGHLFVIFF